MPASRVGAALTVLVLAAGTPISAAHAADAGARRPRDERQSDAADRAGGARDGEGGAPAAAGARGFERTQIPHLDGSGRATLVEIDPSVPGAREFVRDRAVRVPAPGEIDRPATGAPEASPGAHR